MEVEEVVAAKKRKRRRNWILVSVMMGWALLASVVIVFMANQPPNFNSSPHLSRDTTGYDEETSLDILEPTTRDMGEEFPADEMTVPVLLPGKNHDFIFNWDGEKTMTQVKERDYWAGKLQGDDNLELVAFATWFPAADDDVMSDDWTADLTIRDAKTLDKLPDEQLDALGIPASFRTITPTKGQYKLPKIRLIFQAQNMDFVRITHVEGGDRKTGAVVTYDLEDFGNNDPFTSIEGEWLRYDEAHLMWHDQAMKFYVTVLTGEPQLAELTQELGEQVVFDDNLRVQWLAMVHGDVDGGEGEFDSFAAKPEVKKSDLKKLRIKDPEYSWEQDSETALWVKPEETKPLPPLVPLLRYSSSDYARHLGWIRDDGSVLWDWNWGDSKGQFRVMTFAENVKPTEPMKLVFLPKRVELEFEIDGTPDAPNPRDPEDMFELNIPRITLSEDIEEAEDEIIAYICLPAQVAWEREDRWDTQPPKNFPENRTFRNVTPQQMLEWYLKNTPTSHMRHDEPEHVIYANQEQVGFWDNVKIWIEEKWAAIGF